MTVAVLPTASEVDVDLNPKDLSWKACRGSGAGGQHRNKTDSAIQLTHGPTKIMVRCESERSQHQNKRRALELLRAKLLELEREETKSSRSRRRKKQVGSGMRGDKRRTIRLQRNQVVDHVLGKRMSAKNYLRGEVEKLWRS